VLLVSVLLVSVLRSEDLCLRFALELPSSPLRTFWHNYQLLMSFLITTLNSSDML